MRDRPLPSIDVAAGRTLGAEEIAAVTRVLQSGMLSGVWGSERPALEAEFARLLGVESAVACSSGTAALHLAVAAVDPDPGDEIITTPLSDMGSVFPILAQNAVPVFADVDPRTGCLDPAAVEAAVTPRTRAILVVHLFGAPADMGRLRAVADRHGLVLIEDCAQAYLADVGPGGPDGEKLAGTIGDIGCFSLQQSKHITTGDGGLVVTDDARLAERMRLFADKAWPRSGESRRDYLFLALNYRMNELTAGVARAQLQKLPGIVADRRASAADATAALADLEGISLPDAGDRHSFWMYPLLLEEVAPGGNGRFAQALTAEGIAATGGYLARPLYAATALRSRRTYGRSGFPLTGTADARERSYPDGLCPVAEDLIGRRLVVMPWNERFSGADVADIVTAVRKVHGAGRR